MIIRRRRIKLDDLKKQAEAGEIDLGYFDESGFSLTSNSPYAWQEQANPMEVKSQRSQQFNVLGFMNIDQELESYIFTGSITSEVAIACIDEFSKNRTKENPDRNGSSVDSYESKY